MLTEMRAIVAVLVGKALEGDTNAANIVLAKVLPSVKAQMEKVNFAFDTDATTSEQVAQVLDAIATGAIAPDVGRLIIDSVKALAEVRATEELAARIVERYFETMAERAAINAALYDHEVRAERAFIAARAQVAPTVIPEPVASQPVLSVVIKDESPDLRALFGLR